MSFKSISVGVAARALAAGFMAVGVMAICTPASAALTGVQQASLVSAIEQAAQNAASAGQAAGKTPDQIKADVVAAVQLAILMSGATSDEATAALNSARASLQSTSSWGIAGVPAAFIEVAANITSGALNTGAGGGGGGGTGAGAGTGGSAFGTGGGGAGGGGGGGYRPPA